MNNILRVGLAAAAVVVIAIIAINLLPGTSPPGGQPTPTATPEPTASPEPSPSTSASAPPLTQSFISTLYGYSMSYPEGWTAKAGTEPWTNMDSPRFDGAVFDFLYDPIYDDSLFLSVASQPIGSSTPEEWMAAAMASFEGCAAAEPIEVDGAAALITGEGESESCPFEIAVVALGGRGYWIEQYRGLHPEAAAYDRAWFEEILATVQLLPEDAVD